MSRTLVHAPGIVAVGFGRSDRIVFSNSFAVFSQSCLNCTDSGGSLTSPKRPHAARVAKQKTAPAVFQNASASFDFDGVASSIGRIATSGGEPDRSFDVSSVSGNKPLTDPAETQLSEPSRQTRSDRRIFPASHALRSSDEVIGPNVLPSRESNH